MYSDAIIAASIVDLCNFVRPCGGWVGVGTAQGLVDLQDQGIVERDVIATPMTLAEARELFAA